MKLKITGIFISLMVLCSVCHSDQITTNYKLIIPSEGSRAVFQILSNDILSIDSIMKMVSTDSGWINTGTTLYQRNAGRNVGIGINTPTVSLDVAGNIKIHDAANTDYVQIRHTGTDAYTDWSDGNMIFQTVEGTSSISLLELRGHGTQNGTLRLSNGNFATTRYMQFDLTGSGGTIGEIEFVGQTAFNINPLKADTNVRISTSGSYNTVWVDGGTDRVGIGKSAPLVSMDVAGRVSTDCINFSAMATASPDTTTGAPILVVSKDTSGINHLQFFDGSGWRRVTLE